VTESALDWGKPSWIEGHMKRLHSTHPARSALVVSIVLAASVLVTGGTASATPTQVGLGSATNFAILAGALASDVPNSSVTGDLGLSTTTGAAITGFTCSQMVLPSKIFEVDNGFLGGGTCVVPNAGTQVTTPRGDQLASFTSTSNLLGAIPEGASGDLAGLSLGAGLYSVASGTTDNSGTLTLDAHGLLSSVWIFQMSSTLITSAGSKVVFANLPAGVSTDQMACNVFWTVQSSATLTSTALNPTTFVGTIMALADISVGTNAIVHGRLLAGSQANQANGAVTLIMDTITRPTGCAPLPAGTGGGPAGGGGGSGGGGSGGGAAPAASVGVSPAFTG
jgi:Ice-binding-like